MIRKILVALDGSERAPGVFGRAVELAEVHGASLHLLRAVALPPEFPPAGHVEEADHLPAFLLREADAQLRAFAAKAPGRQVATIVIESSQPWRAIIEAADRIDADLIVVGSHGYHAIDYLLGTNAGRVANLANRDVLVVHGRPASPRVATYRSPAR
jgi:nucleotide-binding universal stress UspA family protein